MKSSSKLKLWRITVRTVAAWIVTRVDVSCYMALSDAFNSPSLLAVNVVLNITGGDDSVSDNEEDNSSLTSSQSGGM